MSIRVPEDAAFLVPMTSTSMVWLPAPRAAAAKAMYLVWRVDRYRSTVSHEPPSTRTRRMPRPGPRVVTRAALSPLNVKVAVLLASLAFLTLPPDDPTRLTRVQPLV